MKESISDNRLIDECIYADSGASTLFICHAIEHLASSIGGMRCSIQFNSIQIQHTTSKTVPHIHKMDTNRCVYSYMYTYRKDKFVHLHTCF